MVIMLFKASRTLKSEGQSPSLLEQQVRGFCFLMFYTLNITVALWEIGALKQYKLFSMLIPIICNVY